MKNELLEESIILIEPSGAGKSTIAEVLKNITGMPRVCLDRVAIKHLGATFLRKHPIYKKETIYFGPMGCRTGFYVIFKGDLNSTDIVNIMQEMSKFIAEYEGEVPGADAKSCGNYLDQNLPMAKYEAKKYYNEVLLKIKEENLIYPN